MTSTAVSYAALTCRRGVPIGGTEMDVWWTEERTHEPRFITLRAAFGKHMRVRTITQAPTKTAINMIISDRIATDMHAHAARGNIHDTHFELEGPRHIVAL